MSFIYDFCLGLYALFYWPYLVLTKRGFPGYAMRFGIFSRAIKEQIKAKANIWVHAVSVGEVRAMEGVIDRLSRDYPAYQIILTVTTKTGHAFALEHFKDKALVVPSPIDFSFVAGRFVALIAPKIYIAAETEIWPNLYAKLYRQKIPVAVINGRISERSFGRYKAIRFLLQKTLACVQVWCMASRRDADRVMVLGAEPSRVVVTGNIKFDEVPSPAGPSAESLINADNGPWWVAGSTHPGEEEIVLDVYAKIIEAEPRWRLVIAPRHVERADQIMELAAGRGFKAVKFSGLKGGLLPVSPQGWPNTAVVVVDTIGHLRSLYSAASLVFVGKSLCVGGGHNIIEPAFYGKAIVIGPRYENFKDIVNCFKERDAIMQVEDAHTFEIAIAALSSFPDRCRALGAAAKQVVMDNQGATERSLEHLAGYLV